MTLADVDRAAKAYMTFWQEKIRDQRGISVCRATAHYVAWKWLLGHDDADTFPGAPNSSSNGGWYQRAAYEHVNAQIISGAWDDMSARFLQEELQ